MNFIANDVIVFKFCFAGSHITIHCKKTTSITIFSLKIVTTFTSPFTFSSLLLINPRHVSDFRAIFITFAPFSPPGIYLSFSWFSFASHSMDLGEKRSLTVSRFSIECPISVISVCELVNRPL